MYKSGYKNLTIFLMAIAMFFFIHYQNRDIKLTEQASFEYNSANGNLITVLVKYPQGWGKSEIPFIPASEVSEGSPVWGIRFTKEGNRIFIGFSYSNYPHFTEEDYPIPPDEVKFKTYDNVDGIMYLGEKRNSEAVQNIGVYYNCADVYHLWGEAEISEKYYRKNKKEILEIFKSTKVRQTHMNLA